MANEKQKEKPTAPPAKPPKQETGTSSTGAKGGSPRDVSTKDAKGTSSTGARESTTKTEQRVVRPNKTRERA